MIKNLKQDAQVDLSNCTEVTCPKCNKGLFEPKVQIMKMSALMSPSGQAAMLPLQVYVCSSCLHIMKEEEY